MGTKNVNSHFLVALKGTQKGSKSQFSVALNESQKDEVSIFGGLKRVSKGLSFTFWWP